MLQRKMFHVLIHTWH